MKRIHRIACSLAVVAGFAFAQGPRAGATLDPAHPQTITGPVTAISLAYGVQYPSITVNKLQIKVAPVWYLLEKDFELRAGDNVTVLAVPSTAASDPYLYAVEITNASTNAHIVLRDSAGFPLWTQRGGSGPAADRPCQVLSIATASGVVEQVTMGVGIQMPSLALRTSAGSLLVLKLGPERLLLATDLELKPGDSISVKYAVLSQPDESIALAITKGAATVVLRADTCRPQWN